MNERLLRRVVVDDLAVAESAKTERSKMADGSTRSLRDDFAMAALGHAAGVYAKMTVPETDRLMNRKTYSKDEAVARLAYNMADAMLAAREV